MCQSYLLGGDVIRSVDVGTAGACYILAGNVVFITVFCAVHINVLSLLFGRYEGILPAKICFSLVKSFIRSEQNYYNVTLTQPKQISYITISVADLWLSSGLTSAIGHQ